MIKSVYKWLKYSGVWVTIIVNPFHWKLWWNSFVPDEFSRFGERIEIQVLFLNVRIVLDNGDW